MILPKLHDFQGKKQEDGDGNYFDKNVRRTFL